MGPQPDDEARMMAACLKKRRLNSVVLISQIDTYTLALKKAQEAVYPKEGIHVVGNLTFGGEERDFRMLVTKAKQLRPDIYLLATFPPCLELLTTRMREAGLANFSGIEIFENTTDFRLYEGMWYVCEGNPAPEFSSAYQKRFGEKPITWAANFYDMFNLLVQAFEKAPGGGKPSAVLAIEELEQIKKFSGAGGVLRQDADGVFRVPVVEKIIKNGQPEQAQP
jgi:ABC-type branched-subunit amino acid transport system substrate-binding protein